MSPVYTKITSVHHMSPMNTNITGVHMSPMKINIISVHHISPVCKLARARSYNTRCPSLVLFVCVLLQTLA